jgi:hypothetical protein
MYTLPLVRLCLRHDRTVEPWYGKNCTVNIRQHPSTSVNIRQHPSTSVNIRQHPSTSVNIRQHPSTSVNIIFVSYKLCSENELESNARFH